MVRQDLKMKLPEIPSDDMFSTQKQRDDAKLERVVDLKINEIDDFNNHPFKVIENEEMIELSNSIKEKGVLVPAIVRKKADGRYEMISGHRRKFASELASKETIPCIVRNMTDEEATIVMVDSNMQREEILPSEKAFAYKMKLEALNKQGKRNDLTSDQLGPKLNMRSNVILSNEVGESVSNIKRYIRLTELLPELLNMVDEKIIALAPAVSLSYLTKDEQEEVLDNIECYDSTPSYSQTVEMRKLSAEERLTPEAIENIMVQEKPNQIPSLKVSMNKLNNILPNTLKNDKQKEEYVLKAVKYYRERELSKQKILDR